MHEIKGIARVNFLPGKVEEWKRLTEQAICKMPTRSESAPSVLLLCERRPSGIRHLFALLPDCFAIAQLRSVPHAGCNAPR